MLEIPLAFSNDTISIEFGDIDQDNQVIEILYENSGQIYGFKFFVLGIDITDIYGGDAEYYNFFLSQNSTCWRDDECKDEVEGFTYAGTPIPPGSGVLFYINYAEIGDEIFDENIHVSDQTCLDITEGYFFGMETNGAFGNFIVETGFCATSPMDCNGDYYGSSNLDDCGVCDGTNADIDCAGICYGDSYEDNCGVCDDNPFNDCQYDCNGVPGGDAYEDNCGTCDNITTNDCDLDCTGVWGGSAELDDCGICHGLGSSDPDWNLSCTDCSGELYGMPIMMIVAIALEEIPMY
jgi:hypothetical protein